MECPGYGPKFLYVATFWPLRGDDCGPSGDTARRVLPICIPLHLLPIISAVIIHFFLYSASDSSPSKHHSPLFDSARLQVLWGSYGLSFKLGVDLIFIQICLNLSMNVLKLSANCKLNCQSYRQSGWIYLILEF